MKNKFRKLGAAIVENDQRAVNEIIKYFKENAVENLLPSHCNDLPALSLFYEEFRIQEVKTGMIFEF